MRFDGESSRGAMAAAIKRVINGGPCIWLIQWDGNRVLNTALVKLYSPK